LGGNRSPQTPSAPPRGNTVSAANTDNAQHGVPGLGGYFRAGARRPETSTRKHRPGGSQAASCARVTAS